MTNLICPVCTAYLQPGIHVWHFVCKTCKYEKSNLAPAINTQANHNLINEDQRAIGLKKLRILNFREILRKLRRIHPKSKTLLDVGCAHGWFLEEARESFDVLGVEPDKQVFESTAAKNLPVRLGFFPSVLTSDEVFDVIVFNDVIEHIEDINSILKSCHSHLDKSGVLLLNVPSSNGFFYRLSKIFSRFGLSSSFERMWQKGFPSPHLHYFNRTNLNQIASERGFKEEYRGRLSTIGFSGLYERITHTNEMNRLAGIFILIGVTILIPFLKILPSDIIYTIFKKDCDNYR